MSDVGSEPGSETPRIPTAGEWLTMWLRVLVLVAVIAGLGGALVEAVRAGTEGGMAALRLRDLVQHAAEWAGGMTLVVLAVAVIPDLARKRALNRHVSVEGQVPGSEHK